MPSFGNQRPFAAAAVPVHTILVLLRPQAAHPNTDGQVSYAARPGRGRMHFEYEVVRLWERPAERLLAGELGLAPLAVLGKLPTGAALEDGLASLVRKLVDRLTDEAQHEQAIKLLTTALLLSGLRVDRNVARRIFRGIPMLEESDTYLMILEQGEERGEERATRRHIQLVGEERLGAADEAIREQLATITDPERLERMLRRAVNADTWQEILDTA
jgi:predicted transposase YdaD